MKTDTAPVTEKTENQNDEASRLDIEIPLDEIKGGTCTCRCNTCTCRCNACTCKRTVLAE